MQRHTARFMTYQAQVKKLMKRYDQLYKRHIEVLARHETVCQELEQLRSQREGSQEVMQSICQEINRSGDSPGHSMNKIPPTEKKKQNMPDETRMFNITSEIENTYGNSPKSNWEIARSHFATSNFQHPSRPLLYNRITRKRAPPMEYSI